MWGGPNIAVSLLLIRWNVATAAPPGKSGHMLQLSSLLFNQKNTFLKHKNVDLKILAEVKVVCTDFRRPKSINTTHLRQDIVTTIFLYIAKDRRGEA